ncbi:hypothetical protein N0V82_007342 [Gnomoniopsis sp. IMI 355080]|nr:hypothetical protein N0V82_007342 [Gnomoniopsis sp. IMI 355080]
MSHRQAHLHDQAARPTICVSLEGLRHRLATSTPSHFPGHHYSSMSGPDSSYIISDMAPSSQNYDDDDLDSLPSSLSSGVLSSEVDSEDAQREWEESLEQIQLLLTMVLVPFAGKFLGRKFAYWSWARYMEWAHNVEIRWTNKKAAAVAGAAEVAATL